MKHNKEHTKNLLLLIGAVVVLNVIGNYFYHRFDLTQDNRYTLSEAAIATVESVNDAIYVDVYLEGDFPPEFERLQAETQQLLEEFSDKNPNVKYEFINGTEAMAAAEETFNRAAQNYTEGKQLFAEQKITESEWKNRVDAYNREGRSFSYLKEGIKAAQVEVRENGKVSTGIIYPWAVAYYREESVIIPLLKNQLGATSQERVNASIQNLEYAFADGFNKLTKPKSKRVAFLKGNGELEDIYLADFLGTLREYYNLAPFTLDSVALTPQRTLDQLNTFDLVIVAKPTEAFTDSEKYVLDQYIMNGGASLWLVDATKMVVDSSSVEQYIVPQDLNLNDQFFKYGVRINANLVNDMYSAPIVLATGTENESQYNKYPWFFYPLSSSANNHPIVTNLEGVKFDYASAIDTLENGVKKTVLLSSSPATKLVGLPYKVDFDTEIPRNLQIINEGPNPSEFNAGETPLAVLLEGEFPSFFANRVTPFTLSEAKKESVPTKMVVISDGDMIANQLEKNRPLELGFDKLANAFYGNKEFLLNTVNYLLEDNQLINIRTKEIAVPFLDPEKASDQRTQWQVLNILLPLGLLALFGVFFNWYRSRKYAQKSKQ